MEYHSWTLPSRPHSSSQSKTHIIEYHIKPVLLVICDYWYHFFTQDSWQQTSVAGDDQLFMSLGPVNGLLSGNKLSLLS